MKIGVLKETVSGESRVAATPETVKKMITLNHSVSIEAGAGTQASISDEDYKKNGVKVGFCGQQPSDSVEFCQFLIDEGIDTGPIAKQKELDLSGTLSEIFERISNIGLLGMFSMAVGIDSGVTYIGSHGST